LSSGQFASAPGLELDLLQNCRRVAFADELGDELAVINNQQGCQWVGKLIGTLKKLYNCWDTIMTAPTTSRGESKPILWPAYSVVAAATPEKFYSALTTSDLESGFVNRWLALPHVGFGRPRERAPVASRDAPPKALIEGLKRLPQQKSAGIQILDRPLGMPERKAIGWGPGAEEVYFAFSGKMDDVEATDKQRFELGMRTVENAVRLATIVAVGRGSKTVDVEDMRWGIQLSELALDTLLGDINKYIVEYLEFPRLCNRIFEAIAGEPERWLSDFKLHRRFGRNQRFGNELDRALHQLRRERRIIACDGRSGEHGPKAPGWLAIEDEEE
jgi:hypothetical protein